MTALNQFQEWAEARRDYFIDILRIYLGAALFVKAIYFMVNSSYLSELLAQAGPSWFTSTTVGHMVIAAHLAGGFFLAIGFLTRIAALIQLPVLLGAVFIHLPNMAMVEMRLNLELAALVLFLLVMYAVYGAGKLSVDYYVFRKARTDPITEEMRHRVKEESTFEVRLPEV